MLVIFIVLILTSIFLFAWRRRDRGEEPIDRLPEALHEPLDGQSGPAPAPPSEAPAAGEAPAPIVETPPPPAVSPAPAGPPDDLTRMKGVGPKLVTLLNELGVTHYSQIAAIDQHLGAFRGRILRDRWVEQARYLAQGDTAGFEAQFGKLGG
jgi:predicted flap endonuclease-1-like 5' DNA nuclease